VPGTGTVPGTGSTKRTVPDRSTDLAVSSDGRIYIGLYGGGVLVGHR
jgi:hypothetical protein